MKTRTRPARSTTATVMATFRLAHSAMAPCATARPSFQVMSRCDCTWAVDSDDASASAAAAAANPILMDMQILPFHVGSAPADCGSPPGTIISSGAGLGKGLCSPAAHDLKKRRVPTRPSLKPKIDAADVVVAGERVGGAFADDAAIFENIDALGDGEGRAGVLLDQEHRDAGFLNRAE